MGTLKWRPSQRAFTESPKLSDPFEVLSKGKWTPQRGQETSQEGWTAPRGDRLKKWAGEWQQADVERWLRLPGWTQTPPEEAAPLGVRPQGTGLGEVPGF